MTLLETVKARARLKAAVREFFCADDYLEIDTPIAVVAPGTEVYLRYFATAWVDLRGTEHPLYLRSSPELHMKQAVAAGAARVFQMAPCFRNGGELTPWHHPEFTMLEYYEVGASYAGFIDKTAALLEHTRQALQATGVPRSWTRITVAEAFAQFAGIALNDGDPDLAMQARAAGLHSCQPHDDFETAFFKILLERIEPALAAMNGAILLDYPPSQAALALVEGGVARRFEFYAGRVELCNGFKELLDPASNRARIKEALGKRQALGFEVPAQDQDFYAALERGLPPCCGNALGLDRWLALLLGDQSLDRATPFRTAAPYKGRIEP